MRLVSRYWLLLAIALMFYSFAGARNTEGKSRSGKVVKVYDQSVYLDLTKEIQNILIRYEHDKAWPRWEYANNKEAYDALLKVVRTLSSEQSEVRIVVIEGAASPIGSDEYNTRLALRRAEVLRGIISRMEGGNKLRIHVISSGEDWDTFLSYVEQNYHEPNREKVLAILRKDASNDAREDMLYALDRGRTWNKLVNEYMASARNAVVIHIVESAELAPKSSTAALGLKAVEAPKRQAILVDTDVVRKKPTLVDSLGMPIVAHMQFDEMGAPKRPEIPVAVQPAAPEPKQDSVNVAQSGFGTDLAEPSPKQDSLNVAQSGFGTDLAEPSPKQDSLNVAQSGFGTDLAEPSPKQDSLNVAQSGFGTDLAEPSPKQDSLKVAPSSDLDSDLILLDTDEETEVVVPKPDVESVMVGTTPKMGSVVVATTPKLELAPVKLSYTKEPDVLYDTLSLNKDLYMFLDLLNRPVQKLSSPQLRMPVVAIRSNLLVPALNIGVEVPIGTNWSVGADYYFPWIWPKSDNKNCFELLAWGVEGRYWFGKERTVFDRLQGHSMGLYTYAGYYDFERNYSGYQGEYVNVGLDYTYGLAVGKRKSVHFEFSIGIGYIYSKARKYSVIQAGGPLISDKITRRISYFGPTKANVSLVVPIFKKVNDCK